MGIEGPAASFLWRHVYVGEQSDALADLVVLGPQGQMIGLVSLWDRTIPHQGAEMSIWVGEGYRNEGYGTEALQLALRHAFGDLKLHKVYLRVLAYNARAIRAYEKVGFRIEGRLREEMRMNGRWHDLIYMGVLAEEFSAAAAVDADGADGAADAADAAPPDPPAGTPSAEAAGGSPGSRTG
jgi:RimJ/RimL family protein N-acetyltransferase